MTDDARTRVARGAAHLDKVRPGWAARVDVGTLAMEHACRCIAGQLVAGTTRSTFGRALTTLDVVDGEAFGFECSGESWDIDASSLADYRALQDAWIEAIAARLPLGDGTVAGGVREP